MKSMEEKQKATGENEDVAVFRNEENVIRVGNLSEDTHETDLHELFSRFGPPTRVYVAIDHKFDLSRGFGYANFVNKEDAERAIDKLNGFVYDILVLQVGWSPPRSLFDWDPNGNQGPMVP
ncbi:eukaryotic translation initiation factor 3 subunit G-like [Vitis riparia]|uniref:eukaryotic translation initiation factor 3 subunit G-like n=1 Tax=Vitis riparia TaxID=96939 RepID=UPI00155B04F0|nr:eukaryotic translation initiation factor 3 subunit G-like [Vitis riparia]